MARTLLELHDYKLPEGNHVPLTGYDDMIQLLTDIKDLLTLDVSGGGSKFKPSPRPETAIEVVQREIKDQKMSALEALVT